jgi:hypothetical protein
MGQHGVIQGAFPNPKTPALTGYISLRHRHHDYSGYISTYVRYALWYFSYQVYANKQYHSVLAWSSRCFFLPQDIISTLL